MNTALRDRLTILVEAKEIDQTIASAVVEFIESIEKKYAVEIHEDNGAMLVTHLAMALARIKRHETIEKMDAMILKELQENQVYRDLPEFYQQLEEKLQIKLPDSEKGYIALHLCSLLNKDQ
ncbi:PRD domain-containing protein [Alkaliphilus crotonatoxidans]